MTERHVVIVGGGLAGLSAGCYARASGFRTTIIEHNLALGGVCTAWNRGPYTIDGCIHWLTGGAFQRLYEELGIVPRNEDASFAPPGHTVVQTMLETDYAYWAKTGSHYNAEKDALGALVLERLDRYMPGVKAAVQVSDLATPVTFWQHARSWRGAYEGWIPSPQAMFGHVKKVLPGLAGFYMAGQWVEPGGGVPTALMSGRHVAQLICGDEDRPFVSRADPGAS